MLKSVEMLADILGKGGLRSLGFDIPRVYQNNSSAGSNAEQNPRRATF